MRPRETALDSGLNIAALVWVVGRVRLVGGDVRQGDIRMVDGKRPAILRDEALPDEVFTVGIELQRPGFNSRGTADKNA